MKDVIFDCTDYMKELVAKNELPDDCLMYSKGYLTKLTNNDEVHIYRIQTNLDAQYETRKGVSIVEFKKYDIWDILDTFPAYPNNFTDVVNPKNVRSISLRDFLKLIIEYDEKRGFESWKVTQYKKHTSIEAILGEMQYNLPIIKF